MKKGKFKLQIQPSLALEDNQIVLVIPDSLYNDPEALEYIVKQFIDEYLAKQEENENQ